MYPIDFKGTNIVLNKPDDMTDEQCSSVKAQRAVDSGGFAYFLTAWMPNSDDVKAINEGRPIYLKIIGDGFPPVALFTTDDDGNGNY